MAKDKSFAELFVEEMEKLGFERVPVNEAQLERMRDKKEQRDKMSLDTITKEQFQAYRQVQEKEKKLQDYQTESKENYSTAITGGLVTTIAVAAGATLGILGAPIYGALFGLCGLACGYGTYRELRHIPKTNKAIGGLEKELEELKSKPEYKTLE